MVNKIPKYLNAARQNYNIFLNSLSGTQIYDYQSKNP
jgi:hypothetical protein